MKNIIRLENGFAQTNHQSIIRTYTDAVYIGFWKWIERGAVMYNGLSVYEVLLTRWHIYVFENIIMLLEETTGIYSILHNSIM